MDALDFFVKMIEDMLPHIAYLLAQDYSVWFFIIPVVMGILLYIAKVRKEKSK